MSEGIDFKRLLEPFAPQDVEWRIAQKGAKDGKPWAKVLAYITNRAIMNRLDEVCGPENWQNDFRALDGAFLCGIAIKVNGEWVWKWDGAQESQIEATKGGISGAMKRAGVQWGIGRYLYLLEEGFADICQNGAHWVGEDKQKGVPSFKWNPPTLPAFALPRGLKPESKKEAQPEKTEKKQTGTLATGALRDELLDFCFGSEEEAAARLRDLSTYTKNGKQEFVKWENVTKIPLAWEESLLAKFRDQLKKEVQT